MAISPRAMYGAIAGIVLGVLASALMMLESTSMAHGIDPTLLSTSSAFETPQEIQYLQRSAAAMDAMMQAMQRSPSGDVDRDFVAQMIPHHRGAIEMAVAILNSSHNVQLRRLAEEIIVTQREEIVAMQLAIHEPPLEAAETR